MVRTAWRKVPSQANKATITYEIHGKKHIISADISTVLVEAATSGNLKLVKWADKTNIEEHLVDKNRYSEALIAAARNGHNKVVKYLSKCGVDLNSRDKSYMTALGYASLNRSFGVVSCLCDEGADVDEKLFAGNTPLHIASALGYRDIALLLAGKGASKDVKNNAKCTPLKLAKLCGYKKLHSQILQEKQCDKNDKCGISRFFRNFGRNNCADDKSFISAQSCNVEEEAELKLDGRTNMKTSAPHLGDKQQKTLETSGSKDQQTDNAFEIVSSAYFQSLIHAETIPADDGVKEGVKNKEDRKRSGNSQSEQYKDTRSVKERVPTPARKPVGKSCNNNNGTWPRLRSGPVSQSGIKKESVSSLTTGHSNPLSSSGRSRTSVSESSTKKAAESDSPAPNSKKEPAQPPAIAERSGTFRKTLSSNSGKTDKETASQPLRPAERSATVKKHPSSTPTARPPLLQLDSKKEESKSQMVPIFKDSRKLEDDGPSFVLPSSLRINDLIGQRDITATFSSSPGRSIIYHIYQIENLRTIHHDSDGAALFQITDAQFVANNSSMNFASKDYADSFLASLDNSMESQAFQEINSIPAV